MPLKQYLSYLRPGGGSVRDGRMGVQPTPRDPPELLAGAKGSRPRGTSSFPILPPFLMLSYSLVMVLAYTNALYKRASRPHVGVPLMEGLFLRPQESGTGARARAWAVASA